MDIDPHLAAAQRASQPDGAGAAPAGPFAIEMRTLIAPGTTLDAITPLLGIASGVFFLLAAAALMRWLVPAAWFPWLVVAGAVLSIVLQVIWFSGWAVLPLLLDVVLLWAVFGQHITVSSLRA